MRKDWFKHMQEVHGKDEDKEIVEGAAEEVVEEAVEEVVEEAVEEAVEEVVEEAVEEVVEAVENLNEGREQPEEGACRSTSHGQEYFENGQWFLAHSRKPSPNQS